VHKNKKINLQDILIVRRHNLILQIFNRFKVNSFQDKILIETKDFIKETLQILKEIKELQDIPKKEKRSKIILLSNLNLLQHINPSLIQK
jgi:hypothetical protein